MFCSRQSNNLINKVYERGLRLTYSNETKDYNSPKEFTSLNDRRIQSCKHYSTTNNEFSFQFRYNTNNIRNFQEIYTENRKTVRYGT